MHFCAQCLASDSLLLVRMRADRAMPSARALRLLNEAALLIVVPILILAVVKPF